MNFKIGDSSTIYCMDVAVALSLYISERNTGDYKDVLCTFHDSPSFKQITASSLKDRVRQAKSMSWGGSTNLQATFDLILKSSENVEAKHLPKVILLISDMEFNQCDSRFNTNFEDIKAKYTAAGLEMPTLVFWRVDTKLTQQPVKMDERGTILINGFSPAILKTILSLNLDELAKMTPMNLYLKAIGNKYDFVDELLKGK